MCPLWGSDYSGPLPIFFKRFYLFLDRGEGREKERGKHQCVVASREAPAGGREYKGTK